MHISIKSLIRTYIQAITNYIDKTKYTYTKNIAVLVEKGRRLCF